MTPLERVCELMQLQADELARWVENRWVKAEPFGSTYMFREIDVARVRLIVEMRRDLAIDEDALPTVLSLLDQVYALRRQLAAVCHAIEQQPDDVRDAILDRLRPPL